MEQWHRHSIMLSTHHIVTLLHSPVKFLFVVSKNYVLNVPTRYPGKGWRKQLGNGWLTRKPRNRTGQYLEKGYHGRYGMGYCEGSYTGCCVSHEEGGLAHKGVLLLQHKQGHQIPSFQFFYPASRCFQPNRVNVCFYDLKNGNLSLPKDGFGCRRNFLLCFKSIQNIKPLY